MIIFTCKLNGGLNTEINLFLLKTHAHERYGKPTGIWKAATGWKASTYSTKWMLIVFYNDTFNFGILGKLNHLKEACLLDWYYFMAPLKLQWIGLLIL